MHGAPVSTVKASPPADLIELGRVVAAYGIQGWIKVQPYSAHAEGLLHTRPVTNSVADTSIVAQSSISASAAASPKPSSGGRSFAERSAKEPVWWLKSLSHLSPATARVDDTALSYTVQTVRTQGAHIVAHLAGIDNRDQATQLRGMGVYVSRQAFPPPEQDEYYWVDLIGCQVFGVHEGARVLLGVIDQVLDNGAHGLLKVVRPGPVGLHPARSHKVQPIETLIPFVQAHITHVDLVSRRIESNWPLEF